MHPKVYETIEKSVLCTYKGAANILIRLRQCGQKLGGLCMPLSRDIFTVTFVVDENQASLSLARSVRSASAFGAAAWATVEFQSMRIRASASA